MARTRVCRAAPPTRPGPGPWRQRMGRSTRLRLVAALVAATGLVVAACGGGGSGSGGRQHLVLWFWGAPPAHQQTMQKVLVDGFNNAQDKYTLSVTYDNNV